MQGADIFNTGRSCRLGYNWCLARQHILDKAVHLPAYKLDIEQTVGFDEICDADGEASAEGVVVLCHNVAQFAIAAAEQEF